jgi:hypothetical protein
MHEPLPREFRTNDASSGVLALVWACTLAVIVAVACVGIVSIAAWLRGPAQVASPSTQTTGRTTVLAARSGASSSDLISNMPLP